MTTGVDEPTIAEGDYVGLDVGGTKIATGVLSSDGSLSEPPPVRTSRSSTEDLLDQMTECVAAARTSQTQAVGLGVPSPIEFATGTAKSAVNLPLKDTPVKTILEGRLGLPVFVDNDANVAALAEAHDGTVLVAPHLVMFTVGTGVGGGIVIGGRTFRGSTGSGAEMGHMIVGMDLADGPPPAPTERFPQPGSLEILARGGVLDAMARRSAEEHPDSPLGRRLAAGEEITGHDAVEVAREGDAEGARLLRILGERLGIGIATAINIFDPDVVAIGGGVATAGDLLLRPAMETARKFVLPGVGEQTDIRLARYGVTAGVRGAALLAAHEID